MSSNMQSSSSSHCNHSNSSSNSVNMNVNMNTMMGSTSPPSTTTTSRPTLYRLAANRQYRSIIEHLVIHNTNNNSSSNNVSNTNINDIYWTDRYGSTCLHILCQARSIDSQQIDLVNAVKAICRVAPQVVAWPNAATMTPLHFACEQRLLYVVDNINSNEEQEDEEDDGLNKNTRNHHHHHHHGSLSLSTQLILHLIHACPLAVSIRTKSGFKSKTPFDIACEANADYQVLYQMLLINPRLALTTNDNNASSPYYGPSYSNRSSNSRVGNCGYVYYYGNNGGTIENPLQLLWRHYALHYNHYHNGNSSNTINSTRAMEQYYASTHAKMALLLQAAHCGSVVQQQQQPHASFHLLAAACSVRCPRDYLATLLRKYPQDVARVDPITGYLPLHYAIVNATAAEHQPHTQYVIESLLHAYPQAAAVEVRIPPHHHDNNNQTMTRTNNTMANTTGVDSRSSNSNNHSGRLPLHMAMDIGLTWHKSGVQQLTMAHTNALRTIDPITYLVPFLQSAIYATNSRLHLSTTFELLLSAPDALLIHHHHSSRDKNTKSLLKIKG